MVNNHYKFGAEACKKTALASLKNHAVTTGAAEGSGLVLKTKPWHGSTAV